MLNTGFFSSNKNMANYSDILLFHPHFELCQKPQIPDELFRQLILLCCNLLFPLLMKHNHLGNLN